MLSPKITWFLLHQYPHLISCFQYFISAADDIDNEYEHVHNDYHGDDNKLLGFIVLHVTDYF